MEKSILRKWLKADGGADRRENRVLLHPNCHRQVHSQRLSVVKPRPVKGREFGLSGLTRKCHEPFLGGLGTATCPGYPASRETPSSRGEKVRSAPTLLSPAVANIALHGMEEAIGVTYDSRGQLIGKRAVVRYADDVRHLTRC